MSAARPQYISVKFRKDDEKSYIYRNPDARLAVGDVVEVPTHDGTSMATVVDAKAPKPTAFLARPIVRKVRSAKEAKAEAAAPEIPPETSPEIQEPAAAAPADDPNPRAAIGGNKPPPYDAAAVESFEQRVREQADAAGEWMERGEVGSEEEAERLRDALDAVKTLAKEVEDRRVAEKAPYLEAGRVIDAAYKKLVAPLELTAKRLGQILTVWSQKKRAEQEAARQRALEQARREEEAARAAEAAAQRRRDVVGEAEAEERRKAAEKAAREAERMRTTGAVHSASGGARTAALRTYWKATVTNRRRALLALEDEFGAEIDALLAQLAERRMRAAADKSAVSINGIEFEKEERVA